MLPVIDVRGYRFAWTADVEPDRDANGEPVEHSPQDRYAKAEIAELHRYGAGPFCRLRFEALPHASCIYILTLGGDVTYIGETQSLAERWGPRNFGSIQPRNCFTVQGVPGQQTNCRINNLILNEACSRRRIELWHLKENDVSARKKIETELVNQLNPSWNL